MNYFYFKIKIIVLFIILLNHNVISDNLPPENIRSIKNPSNITNIPNVIFPVSAIPYYPVLISGRNFGNDKNKIKIYIGGMLCENVSFFTNESLNSIKESNEYDDHYNEDYDYNIEYDETIKSSNNKNKHSHNGNSGEIFEFYKDSYFFSKDKNEEISLELYQTMDYLKELVDSSMKSNFQILRCDLKLINISSTYLNAQDIYIVVDGILGVEYNKFLFNDISNCNGIKESCYKGECYLGTCICKEEQDAGPQCSLKRSDNIIPIELDPYYPYITYSNGNSSWSIEFTDLMLLMNGVEPQRGKTKGFESWLYFPFENWELINNNIYKQTESPKNKNNNKNDNNNQNLIISYENTYNNQFYDQKYILNHKDIRITISIIKNQNETNDLLYDHQINRKIYYLNGDLRLLVTIDNLAPYLQNNYSFKLIFNIITNLKERNQCQSRGVSEFEYGKGYGRDDIRWVYIRNDYDILYFRMYGRCIADQLPQSIIIDLDENPFEQENGMGKFFVFIEPFQNNITFKPDFSILKYNSNYNDYLSCDTNSPHENPKHWLVPSIVPIGVIGLSSLILIVVNLLKVNRTSLKLNEIYFDQNNSNIVHEKKDIKKYYQINKNNDENDNDATFEEYDDEFEKESINNDFNK